MKPDEIVQLPKIEACLQDVKAWMTNNFLFLNSDKTEVMLVGPKQLRYTLSSHLPILDGISSTSNTSIKNLGVIINQDLLLDSHIKTDLKDMNFSSVQYFQNQKSPTPPKCRKTNPRLYFIATRVLQCSPVRI